MKAYVYILRDVDNRYYIGSTDNIDRRIKQHLYGHTLTTRRMKHFKLVLSQSYPSLEVARKIELKLKKLKRKDYITKMIEDGYIKMKI
jgi:putative endonuclease